MKYLLLLFFIFPFKVFSQPLKITQQILYINKKLCNSDNKQCKRETENYVIACSNVGNYFYALKQYKQAIYFYSKAQEINLDGHGKISWIMDFSLAGKSAYLNIYEKSGIMQYYGLGINSDTLSSLSTLTEIIYAFNKKKRKKFSMMLFHTADPIFNKEEWSVDWLVTIGKIEISINPFYLDDSSLIKSLSRYMKNIYDCLTKYPDLVCKMSITDNNNFTSSEWRINLGFRLLCELKEQDKLLMSRFIIVGGECQSCWAERNGLPVQFLTLELEKRK